MPSRFLKTHYRRGASVLTPEQIEKIRCLKNKVPAYMIVRNYHINKDRVSDIWDDCERLQQSGEYVLADMLPEPSNHDDIVHFKNDPLGVSNISSENHNEYDIVSDSKKKKTGGKKPKSKSVRISEPSITQNQPTPTSPESSEGLNISREDLNAFYEKEAKRDEKNKAEVNRRLAVYKIFPI
ncbi:uncharacterized protein OCT59_001137 [Rhizophagus irregularis]|uniref:uncharacterized protein n=1 Tax=Rhizophagus irregularis TaxID=588596 RepID=UPI000CB6AD44|nr:hypothetical protein OCT59_001137 [Rhizophagus irregularis]GET61022.1 hypothetical protein GLOIN_2v1786117 [Rhizophagus irregularis DAOM 181602=DAOM 197198]